LAHFVRQERSDSTKCDKENIRLKQLLGDHKQDNMQAMAHHGHIIVFEGESYRMKHALMRQKSH
jgi:DNA replication protein DnaC